MKWLLVFVQSNYDLVKIMSITSQQLYTNVAPLILNSNESGVHLPAPTPHN